MRKRLYLIVLIAFSMSVVGCTITHTYGPYMGKVVDADTGEPIAGAVVLIGFYTEGNSVGGAVYKFADAIEILTDAKGEFRFPPKRITLFRMMSLWDKDGFISIFKPGFAAYPGNRRAFSSWERKHARYIPEDEHIVYYLPKLTTLKERQENHLEIETPGGITNDKMPNLRNAIDIDSDTIFRMEMEKNK